MAIMTGYDHTEPSQFSDTNKTDLLGGVKYLTQLFITAL